MKISEFIKPSHHDFNLLSTMIKRTTIITTNENVESTITTKTKWKRKLFHYNEIPPWQRDNKFILTGYIMETKSIYECYKSLFYFHNETINIFTHLIPSLIIPLLINYEIKGNDFIIYNLFIIGFSICLLFSSIFHTIKVHSMGVASMGSKLDYAGILILISVSLISIIYYGLSDNPMMRSIFIYGIIILGNLALILTWNPKFKSSEWIVIRTSIFILFSFIGLLPIITIMLIYPINIAMEKLSIKYIIWEGFFYLLGAFLYAFRIPEKYYIGKFDKFGNSHQIFHILVVFGGLSHYIALFKAFNYSKGIY